MVKLYKLLACFLLSLFAFSSAQADSINLMTFNIASMPEALHLQINGNFLKPNSDRVNEILNVVDQWDKASTGPNIIAFEEAFDPDVRSLIKSRLSGYYPYNSGDYGQKPLNAGSGLLLMSQYPILDIHFFPYRNIMFGDEMLANKGFIIAKLKYNDSYFLTVIITHLESGDAIDKEQQSQYGTTSFRRGEQMGYIYNQIEIYASTPPPGYENLNYLKTFVMGDFNTTLNDEREQKSISTGMSDNGFKAGEVKYPGQYMLFNILQNTVPSNFLDVRDLATKKGGGKTVDPVLLQEAIQENKFTGSTLPDTLLKNNKEQGTFITRQQSEYKIIDGIFCTYDGVSGTLQTQLTSLNELSQYQYEMSDHFTLLGQFNFQLGVK